MVARSIAVGIGLGIVAGGLTAVGALIGVTRIEYAWPVFAVASTLSFFSHNAKQAIVGSIVNRASTTGKRLEHLKRTVGDIHGLVRLAPYTQTLPLPFGGGWALTGDSSALLAHKSILRRPISIVDWLWRKADPVHTRASGSFGRDHSFNTALKRTKRPAGKTQSTA